MKNNGVDIKVKDDSEVAYHNTVSEDVSYQDTAKKYVDSDRITYQVVKNETLSFKISPVVVPSFQRKLGV